MCDPRLLLLRLGPGLWPYQPRNSRTKWSLQVPWTTSKSPLLSPTRSWQWQLSQTRSRKLQQWLSQTRSRKLPHLQSQTRSRKLPHLQSQTRFLQLPATPAVPNQIPEVVRPAVPNQIPEVATLTAPNQIPAVATPAVPNQILAVAAPANQMPAVATPGPNQIPDIPMATENLSLAMLNPAIPAIETANTADEGGAAACGASMATKPLRSVDSRSTVVLGQGRSDDELRTPGTPVSELKNQIQLMLQQYKKETGQDFSPEARPGSLKP